MKFSKYLLPLAVCACFAACNETKSSVDDITACNANVPCADTTKVCVNTVCLARCTADSCGADEVCADSGLCEKKECVNDDECAGTLVCRKSRCVDSGSNPGGKCSDTNPCVGATVCSDKGVCVDKCYVPGCPTGFACNNDGLCVEGECTGWQKCKESGKVCDVPNRACIPECTAGSCGAGKYCDSDDHLCHEGECSEVDECSDTNKVCNLSSHTCIPKCTDNDSCGAGSGLLCDTDGRCVTPCTGGSCRNGKVCDSDSKLCVVGQCSYVDPCQNTYQVCDIPNRTCVDKCTSTGFQCPSDKYCNKNSYLCETRCTAGGCGAGKVCGNDGYCVDGECSDLEPCSSEGTVCSATYKCVEPKPIKNDCYFYGPCEECTGTVSCDEKYNCQISDCKSCDEITAQFSECYEAYKKCYAPDGSGTPEKCGDGCKDLIAQKEACYTERGQCIDADMEDCTAASDKTACEARNQCKKDKRNCLSDTNSCDKNRTECLARSKNCDPGFQCNAQNECIDSTTADGLGLGAECKDADTCTAGVDCCASDLLCIKMHNGKNYCREAAYQYNDRECGEDAAFTDRCIGNLVVACDEYYGKVIVQDCKTHYIDMSSGTTGTFYGDSFFCAKHIGSSLVTCVEQCTTQKDTKYICGYDLDDYEVNYSDTYTCRYNQEGKLGYFATDSKFCQSTCGWDDAGLCDK